jgi:hypothetical protein
MKPTLASLAARSLCISLALASTQTALADPASANTVEIRKLEKKNEALEKQLADMQKQMQDILRQLADVRQQNGAIAVEQQHHTQAEQQLKAEVTQANEAANLVTQANEAANLVTQQVAQQAAQQAAVQATVAESAGKLSIWGYGEAYYTQPTREHGLTQADLARAVFGLGYQFDDRTRFNSEFEIEHTVTSASDVGEFEVEQFYVDHQIDDRLGFKAGLFLMPAGFLNETHEPANYYGVQRNFVETLIIPSTWREGGLALHGDTDNGFDWQAGITTGIDLSKWNFTPEYAPYRTALELADSAIAPMQATHQELALANASHLSQYASINYRGVPGLTVGGFAFTGKTVPALATGPDNQRVTLWETHARYQPGKLDVEGLYAHGAFSNTAAANAAYPGTPNPLPARFDGWLVQAAYNVWQSGSYHLAPFVRYERYDMNAAVDGIAPGTAYIPTGLVPNPAAPTTFSGFAIPRDTVDTVGANFYLTPNMVFKVDYQKFHNNTDFTRFDLGMGLQF